MNDHNLKAVLYNLIEEIAKAEKVTRKGLATFSRDVLVYVVDTYDIDCVNRMLGVLTPANRRFAIHFFEHFLPHMVERDKEGNFSRFGGLIKKQKKMAERLARIEEFLKDENNNIWTWTDENVQTKVPDYVANLERALQNAVKGNDKKGVEPASVFDLCKVFFDGIGIEKIVTAIELKNKADMETQALKEKLEQDAEKLAA